MNLICRIFLIQLFITCYITYGATNSIRGRIAGGHEAEPHSNPYVVALHMRFLWLRHRLCTGSILSERWILSAGHCVMDSVARWFAMDAIVGAHNLAAISNSQIYPISYRVAHPKYGGNVGPYDIAMMKTEHSIVYSKNVQPIRLPPMNPRFNRNEKLLITGWGALQSTFFYTVLPNKLQEAQVTYLPYEECYRAVNYLKEDYEPNPLKKMANLCTGPISGGIAGCTGDSGGPLVQYVPYAAAEVTTPTETTGTGEKEENSMDSSSSPIPMTTDRPSTTSTGSTSSPIPMTTDRTSTTTTGSTSSPIPMTTDRTSTTTTGSTSSPIPMTTDRTSTTTTGSTSSPIPMTTDRTSTTPTLNMSSPIAMTTDRTLIMATELNYVRALRIDMVPIVVGVISWGVVPCGKQGAPTVYSNVTNYYDFIAHYLYS